MVWPVVRRILFAAVSWWPAWLAANQPAPENFEVALARSCFSNVNVNDAVAAYRVFLKNIGRNRGYELRPDVTIYDDTTQFEAAVEHGTIHFAVMDTGQFFDLEHRPEIRPYFVPAVDGRVGRRYVVLVRRGSGLRSAADLRGRALVMLKTIDNNVCRGWLESLLPDDATALDQFFPAMEEVAKPTAAVLPVFFGQKAACVVDEGAFEVMKELNPQVGAVLEVMAASERVVDYVVCLGERNWISPEAKADTVKALRDLAADPAGRQVLTLFKLSGLVEFKDEYLAPARAFLRHHEELQTVRVARGDHR